jgi:AcrR family transcriptional regulator
MGIAAKTIYNYFANKDEIYLLVLTRGFQLLNEQHAAAYCSTSHPGDRLKAMNRAYLEFGLNYPHYYNIMFNWDVPKYMDYVGTKLEPVAFNEKREGLKLAAISLKALQAYLVSTGAPAASFDELRIKMVKGWSALHGIVSLINSRVLQETLDRETTSFFTGLFKENGFDKAASPDRTVEEYLTTAIDSVLEDLFRLF